MVKLVSYCFRCERVRGTEAGPWSEPDLQSLTITISEPRVSIGEVRRGKCRVWQLKVEEWHVVSRRNDTDGENAKPEAFSADEIM